MKQKMKWALKSVGELRQFSPNNLNKPIILTPEEIWLAGFEFAREMVSKNAWDSTMWDYRGTNLSMQISDLGEDEV